MGTMVYTLLWVMQNLDHQPYSEEGGDPQLRGCEGSVIRGLGIVQVAIALRHFQLGRCRYRRLIEA